MINDSRFYKICLLTSYVKNKKFRRSKQGSEINGYSSFRLFWPLISGIFCVPIFSVSACCHFPVFRLFCSLAKVSQICLILVNGRWKLQDGSKEQRTSHSQRFLILFLFFWMVPTRGRCRFLAPPSLTSKIITRKTYVKELLQISDVIIDLPYTQQKKKLETLTDKVT